MDLGIWATWYDLPDEGKSEYIGRLHGDFLPRMLERPGYLWAAHVENVFLPEREARNESRLVHTIDPAVPTGFRYLLLFGALGPHTFADPSPEEIEQSLPAADRQLLDQRIGVRSAIFVETERVDGPDAKSRSPGITPGPVIQFGTFNSNALENETEMSTWYARSRLPLVAPLKGNVGARKLVSISGWPKHGILYEFASMQAAETNLTDPSDWTTKVIRNLVHAPHSPTLGTRIWPPVS